MAVINEFHTGQKYRFTLYKI